MKIKFKAALLSFCYFVLGTLILMSAALFNNYPLFYADSGAYIFSGFTGEVLEDRPAVYGLFIRFISFKDSFWLVILVQSFFLFYVLDCACKSFLNNRNPNGTSRYFYPLLIAVF